jgi:sensor c-di-GMP phosphodiesterase-like protein
MMKNILYILVLVTLCSSCAMEKLTFHNKKFQSGYLYGKKMPKADVDVVSIQGMADFQNSEKIDKISESSFYAEELVNYTNLQDDFVEDFDVETNFSHSNDVKTNVNSTKAEKQSQKQLTENDLEEEASSDSKTALGMFLGAIAVTSIGFNAPSLVHMMMPILGIALVLSILALTFALKARKKTYLPKRRINMGIIMVFSAFLIGALSALLGFSILALI